MADDLRDNVNSLSKERGGALHVSCPNTSIILGETLMFILFSRNERAYTERELDRTYQERNMFSNEAATMFLTP